jgi:methylenetetrahydrofolate reductase (NADPH)
MAGGLAADVAAARVFSLEVFPPKTQVGIGRLGDELTRLAELWPGYISVTSAAGPQASERTYRTVLWLRQRLGDDIDVVPHIVALAATRSSVGAILARYRTLGIRRLVVIRGDVPAEGLPVAGDFPHARDLVVFIRAETGTTFEIAVAAHPDVHPEAPSAEADLANFAHKVAAGADSALTQCFYNTDAYFGFVDACRRRGLVLPIVPGILPIANYERLVRFCATAGVEIPRWLRLRLDELATDPGALTAFGSEVIGQLCARLLAGGAPGLHFYTLNRAEPTASVWTRLGLARRGPTPPAEGTTPSPSPTPARHPWPADPR